MKITSLRTKEKVNENKENAKLEKAQSNKIQISDSNIVKLKPQVNWSNLSTFRPGFCSLPPKHSTD